MAHGTNVWDACIAIDGGIMAKPKANKLAVSKDNWETPDSFFKYWDDIYKFDGDCAATMENKKTHSYLSNAFEEPWYRMGWCNPPFSEKDKFIDKAIEETECGNKTLMLLPASTGALWFKKAIENCSLVVFVVGRLRFKGAPSSADFDTCLFLFEKKWPGRTPHVEWLELEPKYRK